MPLWIPVMFFHVSQHQGAPFELWSLTNTLWMLWLGILLIQKKASGKGFYKEGLDQSRMKRTPVKMGPLKKFNF